jgi:diguanylate cyclase (GGDEF)-like protein
VAAPIRVRAAVAVVLGTAALLAVTLTSSAITEQAQVAVDDVVQIVAAALASFACFRAGTRSSGRFGSGWITMTCGFGAWIVGQTVWIVREVIWGQVVSSPSESDVGFLVAMVLWAAGLLQICFPTSRAIERLRMALDGLLIAVSLLLIAYYMVLRDMFEAHRVAPGPVGVSLAYPVGDVVLATIVLLAVSQAGPGLRRCLGFLLAAIACLAVSDWHFAAGTVAASYETGDPMDVGWTAGFLLIAVAAASCEGAQERRGIESSIQAAAPYAVLLSAVVMSIVYFALGGEPSAFIRWTALVIFIIATLGLMVHRERWRRAELDREHAATHDALTGLPNFLTAQIEVHELLAGNGPIGVLYCDVDRLDAVNSSVGRAAGDALLQAIARRLVTGLPNGCCVARCAGDEFAVICADVSDSVLRALADQLIDLFIQPFPVAGHAHSVSVTVGLASRRPVHQHADQLLRDGQHAMLKAKRGGPGRVATFEPGLDHPWTLADLALEADLRAALRTGEGLQPYFQPIVRLGDGETVGYEALIRWHHPTRGLLTPGDFIPLAETTGLIGPLGWWMLDQACRCVVELDDVWVSVNVAGAQLGRGELCPAVVEALESSGLPAERLHLEITESQLIDPNPTVRSELAIVSAFGVGVALDDFGTGYSSVALLRDLTINTIKIDLSFTRLIETRPRVAEIVRGLIAFCHHLDIRVIAEGVETTTQAEMLGAFFCEHAQGYLYGHPHPDPTPAPSIATAAHGDER